MSKHFQVSTAIKRLTKEESAEVANNKIKMIADSWVSRETLSQKAVENTLPLKHVHGRVIVKVNLQAKNYHTFSDGSTIRLERRFNEFNRRITEPVNAIVVSAESVPAGSEILIGHNCLHDTNKIFDCNSISPEVGYFSLPENDCFAWRNNIGEMMPMQNYEFGLRVFKPYNGIIQGIEPELIKDNLYVITGEFKGKVVQTLKACDYQIIYQGQDGQEKHLIRFRHSSDENFEREEVLYVSNELTTKVKKGELHIGISVSDAKSLINYNEN